MKFVEEANKIALFKNQIYSISDHKFQQVKKYLNKHLKKEFIVSSYASFASLVLFIKKLNERLRFCVNYKKLNVIIKRNRYFISLINEILIKTQKCKYLTRLKIITIFNELRMYLDNKNFIIYIYIFQSIQISNVII